MVQLPYRKKGLPTRYFHGFTIFLTLNAPFMILFLSRNLNEHTLRQYCTTESSRSRNTSVALAEEILTTQCAAKWGFLSLPLSRILFYVCSSSDAFNKRDSQQCGKTGFKQHCWRWKWYSLLYVVCSLGSKSIVTLNISYIFIQWSESYVLNIGGKKWTFHKLHENLVAALKCVGRTMAKFRVKFRINGRRSP